MTETILEIWDSTAPQKMILPIIPDGCRDLIFKHSLGKKPCWFVWPLTNRTCDTSIKRGDVFKGYRLKPGTHIDIEKLLASVSGREFSTDDICDRLDSYTNLSASLEDALACLGSDISSVSQVARELGTNPRSLQRLLMKGTGKSPVYWLQLARVRKAGRAVQNGKALADIAVIHGYADQAHMSREFRRWLDVSPAQLKNGVMQGEQLFAKGFS